VRDKAVLCLQIFKIKRKIISQKHVGALNVTFANTRKARGLRTNNKMALNHPNHKKKFLYNLNPALTVFERDKFSLITIQYSDIFI
jgi:hypothetical protein